MRRVLLVIVLIAVTTTPLLAQDDPSSDPVFSYISDREFAGQLLTGSDFDLWDVFDFDAESTVPSEAAVQGLLETIGEDRWVTLSVENSLPTLLLGYGTVEGLLNTKGA